MRPPRLQQWPCPNLPAEEIRLTFDPVNEPDAYRRSLLEALGDRDPAIVLAAGPAAARSLHESAGPSLRVRPEPGEWSVLECLAHLADSELVASARMRWMAAEEQPDIVGYDQDLWVTGLRQVEEDAATLLGVFDALRRWNLTFWARLPVADRARYGVHRERGAESIELTFRLMAGHDEIHLAQARRALVTVRGLSG
jgi:hypothetical protein